MSVAAFQYAVVRVVPRIERGECLNAGVILFCRTRRFLDARVELDEDRLAALDPQVDVGRLRRQLDSLAKVATGDPAAGRLAALEPSERFGWLVAPSSTMIQASPVHTGLCHNPEATLDRLLDVLVRPLGRADRDPWSGPGPR